MIKILIAEGRAIVRFGLLHLFSMAGDIDVMGAATHGGQVIDLLSREVCDLVLLDLSMQGLDGIELIGRIQACVPKLPVLVLGRHDDARQAARSALKAGAAGYVDKDADLDTLLAAVRTVAAGGRHIDPGLAQQMVFEDALCASVPSHEQLSQREVDVLRLLVDGKSVNRIAGELSISNKTVSAHKARMMRKMGFQNTVDMLRYGIACGLSG